MAAYSSSWSYDTVCLKGPVVQTNGLEILSFNRIISPEPNNPIILQM